MNKFTENHKTKYQRKSAFDFSLEKRRHGDIFSENLAHLDIIKRTQYNQQLLRSSFLHSYPYIYRAHPYLLLYETSSNKTV